MQLPWKEEWLVEVVVDADDQVVVGDAVDGGPRELPVYQNPLQHNTHILQEKSKKKKKERERDLLFDAEGVNVAVGDFPGVVAVGIVGVGGM